MVNLESNIKKTVLYRVLFVTLILGSTAAIYYGRNLNEEAISILVAVSLIFLFSLLFIATESFFQKRQNYFNFLLIFTDVILVTYLVYSTGGRASPLVFLYPLIIIFSSILVSKTSSYISASICAISYILVIFYQINSEFPNLNFTEIWKSTIFWSENGVIASYFHLTGFFVIAMLGGYLSERIIEAKKRLGESEKSLERLQNIHENILESLTSGVITLNNKGNIITVNRSGLTILNIQSFKDINGKNLEDIINGITVNELINKTRDHLYYTTPSGKKLILGFSASPLADNDGNKQGFTIVFQDLTEIKSLEERVNISEKLAVLGQLAAGLAHEFRNPLSAISGTIEILGAEKELDDVEQKLVLIANREIEKLNLLVEDFLLLSEPLDSRDSTEVDIGFIIEDTVKNFVSTVKRENLDITSDLEKGALVLSSSLRLKQALWNLLNNSMDAMPRGGKINIITKFDNGDVKIVFSDDGEGIKSENISKVFQPFFTTKEVGTGLGLAIVQKVVESYNGSVNLSSTLGEGTTFTILMPSSRNIHT